MSDDRITNLEIKLSFTEDLIEKLNETIYKQQQQIEFLYRELKAIKEQASSSGGSNGSLQDEIPRITRWLIRWFNRQHSINFSPEEKEKHHE